MGCYPISKDVPKMGEEVAAPWGWTYTYCTKHPNDIGCSNKGK